MRIEIIEKIAMILFLIGAISFVVLYLFMIGMVISGCGDCPVPLFCKIWMASSGILLITGGGIFLYIENKRI